MWWCAQASMTHPPHTHTFLRNARTAHRKSSERSSRTRLQLISCCVLHVCRHASARACCVATKRAERDAVVVLCMHFCRLVCFLADARAGVCTTASLARRWLLLVQPDLTGKECLLLRAKHRRRAGFEYLNGLRSNCSTADTVTAFCWLRSCVPPQNITVRGTASNRIHPLT